MDIETRNLIEACARDSHAGRRHFGEVVTTLADAGIESYLADYRAAATTYYDPAGRSHAVPLPVPRAGAPATLDATALVAVIRGAQRGEVMYPEFVERSIAAGCVGYFVWIAGRHVAYFGRDGSRHVERFPGAD